MHWPVEKQCRLLRSRYDRSDLESLLLTIVDVRQSQRCLLTSRWICSIFLLNKCKTAAIRLSLLAIMHAVYPVRKLWMTWQESNTAISRFTDPYKRTTFMSCRSLRESNYFALMLDRLDALPLTSAFKCWSPFCNYIFILFIRRQVSQY